MAAFEITVGFHQGAFMLEVDVRLDARVIAFYGPSGSGKTTTLELLAGLRRPTSGRLACDGTVFFDAHKGIDLGPRDRRVGYVPQDVLLFPHMDVRANVAYGASKGPARTDALLERFSLTALAGRQVTSLSGGERQRVALARALNADPRMLLLDEPLAAIDVGRRRQLIEMLSSVRDELGLPIVYVAHAADEIRALADHVVLLDGGRVVGTGSPSDCLP